MKFKVLISNLESCVEDHCKKVFGDDTITVALVCRLDVKELGVGDLFADFQYFCHKRVIAVSSKVLLSILNVYVFWSPIATNNTRNFL